MSDELFELGLGRFTVLFALSRDGVSLCPSPVCPGAHLLCEGHSKEPANMIPPLLRV